MSIPTEHIQPSDFLENLGCSLAAWERHTHTTVDRQQMWARQEPLLKHSIYYDCSMSGNQYGTAEEVQWAFNDRVKRIMELYQHDNDPNRPPLSESETRPLEGVAVLHLTFDSDPNVDYGVVNSRSQGRFLPIMAQAYEQHGWHGVINVDFTDEATASIATGNGGDAAPHWVFYQLAKRTNKPIVLIIDGYGLKATDKWGFAMIDQWFERPDVIGTLVIRSTDQQARTDRGYGSIWEAKAPKIRLK